MPHKTWEDFMNDAMREAMQTHFNYYMNLVRRGENTPEDKVQIRLARRRLANGKVKPLPEEQERPAGIKGPDDYPFTDHDVHDNEWPT